MKQKVLTKKPVVKKMDNNYINNYGNNYRKVSGQKKVVPGGKGLGVYGLAVGANFRAGNTNSNSS
jgi:hypothetical protein